MPYNQNWSPVDTEAGRRYIIYSDLIARYPQSPDIPKWRENALFWFIAACYGHEQAKREML